MSRLLKRIADLSPEKKALLAMLLRERRESPGQHDPVRMRPDPRSFPVSFGQQRLWFLEQLQPGRAHYNVPAALRLRGPLHIGALEKSLNTVVDRHEVLRARFEPDHGQPVQRITPKSDLPLPVIDLQSLDRREQRAEVTRLATGEALRPFDLEHGPLIRASLIRLGQVEHVMTLTMHHIVCDGWSFGILVMELNSLYRAFQAGGSPQLPEPSIQYADYAHWQRDRVQGPHLRNQMEYWRAQLAPAGSGPDLPVDRQRPAVETNRGACHGFELPIDLSENIRALGRSHDATLFMVLLAAFNALLYRYTGQEEVWVGSPVAGRSKTELNGLIGLFVNTLVMRTRVDGGQSFRELLERVRETTLGAYSNQEVPFESLVEALQPQRSLSYSPLFQVMFVLQEDPTHGFDLPGLRVEPMEIHGGTAKFDLTLFVTPESDMMRCLFEYNRDLFEAGTIARMAAHFRVLLKGVVERPDLPLSAHPLLGEAEEKRILLEWNDTFADDPRDLCIHHLFELQAARTPDAVSLVFENERLSYHELNARANRLARYLRRLGVGPEELVGLCMERSPEMIVAMLGILKAGGAYVPLDPSYPAERLAVMVEDSGVRVIITQSKFRDQRSEVRGQTDRNEEGKKGGRRKAEGGILDPGPWTRDPGPLPPTSNLQPPTMICLDTDWPKIAQESDENPAVDLDPSNLAYVLFTSGSTGRPKGIAIEHRSVTALLQWAKRIFPAKDMDGMLASTSISWDLSVFELFTTLASGGTIILAQNALQLPELPDAGWVTLINTVPSAISELLHSEAIPESVRTINLAGEPLPKQLVDRLYGLPSVERVFDLYGPGEDTTYSTFALRHPGGPETIGRPIANSRTYLLDPFFLPVPTGVTGQLFMGGGGLARGYFHRPEMTAESFVPDPYGRQHGARLYKTGDMASYLPDGTIRFLGRMDHQVKIRGFRVELGEIQAALSRYPALKESIVVVREDVPGQKRLVGYAVADRKPWPNAGDLRRFLQQKLPDYMVPSAFVLMEALPMTPNGKVDRRALPAPDNTRAGSEIPYAGPRDSTEETLAGIWRELLGCDQVGIHDDFFTLGGHSLLATRMISRVREVFHVEISVREVFQATTISGLAERLRAMLWAREGIENCSPADEREEGEL